MDRPKNPCFNLVLTSKADAGFIKSSTKLYQLEAESEIIQSSIGLRQLCLSENIDGTSPSSDKKKTVQFALPTPKCDSSSRPQPQTPLILDTCATISAVPVEVKDQRVLGWLSDNSHKHNITYVRNVARDLRSRSLEDLITASCHFQDGQADEGFIFSDHDRLRLSLNLACSVLQFHGSWLKQHWRPRDLMLESPDTDRVGDLYVPWTVGENLDDSGEWKGSNAPTLIRNQILFPLGLVLVELSLCQTLDFARRPEDEDCNEAHANLKTATRLLPKVEELSGPEYADVVDRCLSWHDRRETSLETEKMQEEVFELIIFPLMENLRSFEDSLNMY